MDECSIGRLPTTYVKVQLLTLAVKSKGGVPGRSLVLVVEEIWIVFGEESVGKTFCVCIGEKCDHKKRNNGAIGGNSGPYRFCSN